MQITIKDGWETPVCPFCKSKLKLPKPTTETLEEDTDIEGEILKAGTEIQTGYTTETCKKCNAVYSIDCDEFDLVDDITEAEFFTIHNFKNGLYHPHLSENFDMIYPEFELSHLVFARIKDGGIYDLDEQKALYTVSEVAKITGYSVSYYRRNFTENPELAIKLKLVKSSGGWLIPHSILSDPFFKKKGGK